MSEPIYKFSTGRFLPDWYQLSKEEQDSILAKLHEASEKLGAKTTILCNTYWSTDQLDVGYSRGVPEYRGCPEVHGDPSGAALGPIRRGFERVGYQNEARGKESLKCHQVELHTSAKTGLHTCLFC